MGNAGEKNGSIAAEPVQLSLRRPFVIAHGTSTERTNVLVHADEGVGEAALPPYYGVSPGQVIDYVRSLGPLLREPDEPFALEDVLDRLPDGPASAQAAVDMALHDLWARRLGQPLFRLWGLNPERTPPSSYTLSIPDDETDFREQIRSFRNWPVLKVKLGSGELERDESIVRIVREETTAFIGVDVNGGWSITDAVKMIPILSRYGVIYVEQPLDSADPADWFELRRRLPDDRPLILADENIRTLPDLVALAGAVDGINVKVARMGGLREARRAITLARALDLRVLVGCMVESSVGISAAAQLAPLADFADLDGALLLTDDPYTGVTITTGRIRLPSGPGLGAERKFEG